MLRRVVDRVRIKDMIIRGGENIYPCRIEEFLYRNPKVQDVQVMGIPSEKFGEEVAAFIKVKHGENLTDTEIPSFCKGRISFFKILRYVYFVDEYPMTASGKIQKYKLREMAQTQQ